MKVIGIGLIGWGFMGRMHTHALKSIASFYPNIDFQVRLVWVCSGHIENAKEAAQLEGFEHYTDDYTEVLNDPHVDVVSICTPNALHEEMAIAALKAGKHVYIDKPLAVSGESADRIAKCAQDAPGMTRMVFNNRYLPATMRAKELIDEGRIGDILSFEARYLHSGSIDPNKPIGWKQEMQGGVILDLGSHALDLLTWLIGYPSRVSCRTRTLYKSRPTKDGGTQTHLSEDYAIAALEMPGGALGTVEASKIATGANDDLTLEIRGTKGAIKFDGMNPGFLEFYDQTLPEAPLGGMRGFVRIETMARYPKPGGTFLPPKNAIGWDRGHIHCYYTFLDCVAHGKSPDNDLSCGARLQHLMDKLILSDRTNQWVDID